MMLATNCVHTDSRALRAEYCIVGTPHKTAIYFSIQISVKSAVKSQQTNKPYFYSSFACCEDNMPVKMTAYLDCRSTLRRECR